MKSTIVTLIVVTVLAMPVFSQTDSVLHGFRTSQNDAFSFGERLSFEISYGFLTAAEAFMTISPAPFNYNGRKTYEINFDVNSRSSFDLVYKVRDNYKTFIDVNGIFPWRFEQHINETNFKKDFEATFIQESSKVYTKINFIEDKHYWAPHYVQDLISSFYYARTLDYSKFKKGDMVTIPVFSDNKIVNLTVSFQGREEVDVAAGKFRTFILKPELTEGFTTKTSDIYIWLTDDDRKIPVKVKMKIIIGALVAELTQYTGLNGPLGAKIE
jgi:hypothetical protein